MEDFEPIEQKYAEMYMWDLKSSPTSECEATVIISLAEGFDASTITCELGQDKESLCVSYPRHPPFLCGHSFVPFESVTGQIVDNNYVVSLVSKQPSNWRLLFDGPHKETHILDPLSSFTLYQVFNTLGTNQKNEPQIEIALGYIQSSAAMGFAPAIVLLADLLAKQSKTDRALELLLDSYQTVKSPIIAFRIAIVLFQRSSDEDYKNAFDYFTNAATDSHLSQANSFLGLYYSPLTRVPYEHKDAVKAKECFEKALEANPDEIIALQNYALLLYVGNGIPRNKARAIELNKHARELAANIPDINTQLKNLNITVNEGMSTPVLIGISITAAVALIAGGFFAFRNFKKK